MAVLRLVCALVFVVVMAGSSYAAPVAVGRTYDIPVGVWTKRFGDTTNTVTLLLPEALDEKGTITLILRGDPSSRLIRFSRADMPPQLDFLFGESDRLYVRVVGPADWELNSEVTHQNFVVDFPYDQSKDAQRSRRIRLVDAAGRPLQDFALGVSLEGRFSAYRTPPYQAPLDGDAQAIVPPVIDIIHSRHLERTQPSELYHLYVTDPSNGQTFFVELMQYESAPLTLVVLPVSTKPSANIKEYRGRIIGADGGNPKPTTVTIIQTYFPPTRQQIMDRKDKESVIATRLEPGPDGRFSMAIGPAATFLSGRQQNLEIHVREHEAGLFNDLEASLQPDRETMIKLRKRLMLAAQMFDKNGQPVDTEKQPYTSSWGGVCVREIKDNCELSECSNLGFRSGYTTGSTFLLRNIPVPGRYILENQGNRYGPIDLGETSPTEVIAIHAMQNLGHIKGMVRDEAGRPLPNALVAFLSSHKPLSSLMAVEDLPTKLAAMDTSAALSFLANVTSGVIEYQFTDSNGQYAVERSRSHPQYQPHIIMATAPGRFTATIADTSSDCDAALNADVKLPDLHLPLKASVSGVVTSTGQVPDYESPGMTKSLVDDATTYSVFHRSTMNWFKQERDGTKFWQYETPATTAVLGQRFTHDVPVGTAYELGARAAIPGLTMHTWKQPALQQAGSHVELEPGRLKALKPFWLKVVYPDGTPGSGLRINAMHAPKEPRAIDGVMDQPYTNDDGLRLLYTDSEWSPRIELSNPYRRTAREWFKPQRLDSSTSVPTVTIRLESDTWRIRGRNPGDVRE